MNKVEYLDALKAALKDTDKDIMEEIISDYEEHFQVGTENGKTEEQICEDLGSIDDLVAEIKEVYTTDKKAEKKTEQSKEEQSKEDSDEKKGKFFGEWNFSFDNINGEAISNAINNAINTAGEALSNIDVKELGKNVKKTVEEAATSLNNFADDYLKNQGNPFDFGKRHGEGFKENVSKSYDDQEEKKNATEESNVSFGAEDSDSKPEEKKEESEKTFEASYETSEDNVETPSTEEEKTEAPEMNSETADSEQVTVAQEEKPEEVKEEAKQVESQDSKASKQLNLVVDGICADVKVRKSSNGKVNINYENNGNERQKQMYEFYSYKEGDTVYAGIRKVGKAVFFFNFATNSININVELPDYMGSVQVKTASGDINVAEVTADRVMAEAASGDITMNKIVATDFRVKSSSGDLDLNEINSVQLYASTMSGDVEANNLEAQNLTLKSASGDVNTRNVHSNIMDLSSLSGDVDIIHLKSGECKIRSTSGEVDINDITMNNADVTAVSGDLKLTGVIGDGLRASSTSGNVTVDVNVKRCHASSKSGNVDVTCSGDLNLESNSTSGNVNVHLKNYGNGYNIKSRTTSGGLYINYGEERLRNLKTGTYTYGKQSSELVLGSVSGDIHVND